MVVAWLKLIRPWSSSLKCALLNPVCGAGGDADSCLQIALLNSSHLQSATDRFKQNLILDCVGGPCNERGCCRLVGWGALMRKARCQDLGGQFWKEVRGWNGSKKPKNFLSQNSGTGI
jgi:hypothetical protein